MLACVIEPRLEIAGAEVEIVRTHVASDLVLRNRYMDPSKWDPLIDNFRHDCLLADSELGILKIVRQSRDRSLSFTCCSRTVSQLPHAIHHKNLDGTRLFLS